jgi:hypothetical protein
MLARTGGSEGATEGCGSLLPWHWPCALVVEQLTAALELFSYLRRLALRCSGHVVTAPRRSPCASRHAGSTPPGDTLTLNGKLTT